MKKAKNGGSAAQRVYEQVRAMAMTFRFKPGERINEGDVSRSLGVSRTPLREALTRIASEGLLRVEPGRGFFSRNLNVQEIFDLYELRTHVEGAAIKLANKRADAKEIDALLSFLDDTGPDPGERTTDELVDLDQTFHERLVGMSGNAEMVNVIRNINSRIRLVRWIDMDQGDRRHTQNEHRQLLLSLKKGDEEACLEIIEKHIDHRLDQITAALKEGYAQLYLTPALVTRD